METSERRQIPTTNACVNFRFKGLRKKKNFTLFRSFREKFCHAENYFRHCQKLYTSRQRPIQYAHVRDLTKPAAGRAFGPDRAVPGIIKHKDACAALVTLQNAKTHATCNWIYEHETDNLKQLY